MPRQPGPTGFSPAPRCGSPTGRSPTSPWSGPRPTRGSAASSCRADRADSQRATSTRSCRCAHRSPPSCTSTRYGCPETPCCRARAGSRARCRAYPKHGSASSDRKKLSLRASVTSELHFDEVRLPRDAVLPGARGLKGPLSCLSEARFGIVWGVTGAARSCFEAAAEYSRTREQFGQKIGGFQLTQSKLAWMLADLQRAQLLALHLGRLKETGRITPEQVSLGKMSNVRTAIEIARQARTVLGANGITLEYPVIRHANNLESVLTYEGTEEIHSLALGEAITGIPAYR